MEEPTTVVGGVRPPIPDELVDELLAGRALTAEAITGPRGLLQELTGRLVERALGAELADHLGYEHGEQPPLDEPNRRNGTTSKTLATPHGEVRVEVPRDRGGSFEPRIVQKHQRRFEGFDEKIIALYAGGMTTRQIERHLEQVYGVAVGRDLVSRVTDAVLDDVSAWQSRPLEACYPIVWMDALVVKIRDQGRVQNHHAYLAIGITDLGVKDVLGLWITRGEGAKQWMAILTELKNRGLEDVLVCCVDGLKGFPDAIEAVWPDTIVQTCIVHMIRNSLRFVSYKDRRLVAKHLRPVYSAPSEEAAQKELDRFAEQWDARYPMIAQSWRANWERVTPFLSFPPELRRVVYTTNQIEALNSKLRIAVRSRGHFPDQDAARKLIYLQIKDITKRWERPSPYWPAAIAALAIHYPDRITI
jgi:putative transposase